MDFILLFIIIFSIGISIRNILQRRVEETIPLAVVLITILIYLGGLFDNLDFGVYIVYLVSFCSVLFNIFYLVNCYKKGNLKVELGKIFTPGFYIYLILFIFFCYFNRNTILEDYDDFNHWGLIIKNMFYYNGYGTVPNSRITFNEYPPFTATFGYLFLKLGGVYLEEKVLIAQNFLYLSLIIFITRNLKFEKNGLLIILNILFILFGPLVFSTAFYYNLLVDGLLGVLFALGLYVIYCNDEDKIYKNISFISILTGLSLTKSTGIFLAIVLIVFEFIKKFLNRGKEKSDLKITLLFLIVPLILIGGWYTKVNLNKNSYEWDISSALKMEYKVKDKDKIIKNYFEAFINKKEFTNKNISLFWCILALLGLSIYVYSLCKTKKEKVNYVFVSLSHFVIFIGFFFGLLWVYLTFFINVESETLNSYVRYFSTFLISWLAFNFIIICNKKTIKGSAFYIIVLITLFFVPFDTLKERYINKEEFALRLVNQKSNYTTIEKYKNKLNSKDKVFFYSNLVNPFVVKLNRYEFFDINIVNRNGNFSGSRKDFIKMIIDEDIDYIYIWKTFPDITEKYRTLFEDDFVKEETLYRVVRKKNDLRFMEVV